MVWRSTATCALRGYRGRWSSACSGRQYEMQVQQNLTAVLAEGVAFEPKAHELWGPKPPWSFLEDLTNSVEEHSGEEFQNNQYE